MWQYLENDLSCIVVCVDPLFSARITHSQHTIDLLEYCKTRKRSGIERFYSLPHYIVSSSSSSL